MQGCTVTANSSLMMHKMQTQNGCQSIHDMYRTFNACTRVYQQCKFFWQIFARIFVWLVQGSLHEFTWHFHHLVHVLKENLYSVDSNQKQLAHSRLVHLQKVNLQRKFFGCFQCLKTVFF